MCWTKGTRHKVTHKKLAEPKIDIKSRVSKSPDMADSIVLLFAHEVHDKLPENELGADGRPEGVGSKAIKMPEHIPNYEDDVGDLYN